MLLEECYEAFGGNIESVRGRIPKDALICKFLIKFLSDPSYDTLCEALKEEDYEKAFRAAHTLKGVCDNLALSRLGESATVLTECLREKANEQVNVELCSTLASQVTEDYRTTVDAITVLQNTME